MKKKVLSALIASTMTATLLAGCGTKNNETTTKSGDSKAAEGKVLNCYVWNEEFKTRVTDHYPGYQVVDGTTGKIGDVTVKWNITPSDDLAFQNNLDATLLKQKDAAADDKIDLFCIEADYMKKYVNSGYCMSMKDLGITADDMKNQYKYTQDYACDYDGNQRAISWQAAPGVLFYNRNIAQEVLGTEDPEAVQAYVKDWDTFLNTADSMKAKGYNMVSSVNDAYRVYSNNVTSKWVVDGKLNVDPNIKKWVDDSKRLVDAGETNTYELWSDDWKKGFFDEGKVFCYFGPAWLLDFCMAADTEGSVANQGRWGATQGPQGFYWGGTWVAAAEGTDNASLVKDIMLKITCDTNIMKDIAKSKNDFVNNQPAMEEMANDPNYSVKLLGGQNPLPMYNEFVGKIDLSNQTPYDQACTEEFQGAMKEYFDGNTDYEGALALFDKAVHEKHPDLK